MKKAENVKEFVERIDASKKMNPKDLSSDQDLSIAIMNLISIEEHLVFSGAKTGKNSYYDLIKDIRETRKNLLQKIIPSYEGEVWCISKHLLATSMRLMEVGTKQQSLGRDEEAYKLFNSAYDMYCLFWGLNMGMIETKDLKWVEPEVEELKKITVKANEALKNSPISESAPVVAAVEQNVEEEGGALAKMKRLVRKAVNCCIE
ncbi:MAG: hypothetical protein IJS88_04275 [Alphaproteobacteria bacterium]|nr:hypothetical protein [Alphaproteobacteria bacterium]